MKNFVTRAIYLTVALCILISLASKAQNPTYTLSLKNIQFPAPNTLQFDIYLLHTNYPIPFVYAAGQYFLNFNNAILAGDSAITGRIVNSDLPDTLRPATPFLGRTSSGVHYINMPADELKQSNIFVVSHTGDGTLIARVQLTKKNGTFDQSQLLDLTWRNTPKNPNTQIFATINGQFVVITDPTTHF